MQQIIFAFDIAGTIIFAITGAVSAVKLRLDLLGVVVFACTVGVGGGILRDTIIGATPVAALQNETYLFGFRKHEQGQNAKEIPMFDPLIAQGDEAIQKLKAEALSQARRP